VWLIIQEGSVDSLYTLRYGSDLNVNINAWISGDVGSTFETWKRAICHKKGRSPLLNIRMDVVTN